MKCSIAQWKSCCRFLSGKASRVEIQAHPWDFCEENNETVDIVKSFRSDNVKYVYSVPHTFSTTKASATWRACCAMPGSDLSMS